MRKGVEEGMGEGGEGGEGKRGGAWRILNIQQVMVISIFHFLATPFDYYACQCFVPWKPLVLQEQEKIYDTL